MITNECLIYVVDKGFVKPWDLNVGDPVYTLDLDRTPSVTKVSDLTSEFHSGKVLCIDSGAHNVDVTEDSRLLYHSERHGTALISWSQIAQKTPDKSYSATKYLPVLSWPKADEMRCSLDELEYIARMCAVYAYDRDSFKSIIDRCSSSDAIVLIDMLEFWCSRSPGNGWFARAQVKSRSHIVKDKFILDELTKIAVLAGYTSAVTNYESFVYALKVSYESMPIPGSRPKNEKYFHRYYTGNLVNINADNKPILGKSKNRCFYLPTSSMMNL